MALLYLDMTSLQTYYSTKIVTIVTRSRTPRHTHLLLLPPPPAPLPGHVTALRTKDELPLPLGMKDSLGQSFDYQN
jgi:hypothetical protein